MEGAKCAEMIIFFLSVLNVSLSLNRKSLLSPTETQLEALGFLKGPVREVIYVSRPIINFFIFCHVGQSGPKPSAVNH